MVEDIVIGSGKTLTIKSTQSFVRFKDDALFDDNGNVFRSDLGTLKFRGDTVFKNNFYLAIDKASPDCLRQVAK
ncbi:unnamed protein product [Laminaria digitata]